MTPQQDRNYFRSTYFREPGGMRIEMNDRTRVTAPPDGQEQLVDLFGGGR